MRYINRRILYFTLAGTKLYCPGQVLTLAVVLIATATAIYSLGHGLHCTPLLLCLCRLSLLPSGGQWNELISATSLN